MKIQRLKETSYLLSDKSLTTLHDLRWKSKYFGTTSILLHGIHANNGLATAIIFVKNKMNRAQSGPAFKVPAYYSYTTLKVIPL